MIRLRRRLPTPWYQVALALFAAALFFNFGVLMRLYGAGHWPGILKVESVALAITSLVSAPLLGLVRPSWWHPLFSARVRDWLVLTPWRPGRPLPFVSPTLGRGDFICLTGMVLCFELGRHVQSSDWPANAALGKLPPALPLFLFLAGYNISSLRAAILGGLRVESWLGIFGLTLIPLFRPSAVITYAILAAVFLMLSMAHAKVLLGFPWGLKHAHSLYIEFLLTNLRPAELPVGTMPSPARLWPYAQLDPRLPPRFRIDVLVLLPVLIAAWTHVFFRFAGDQHHASPKSGLAPSDHPAFMGMMFIALASCRVFAILIASPPSIGFIGRIFTGRFIMPDYDKVFVPSIVSVVVFVLWPWGGGLEILCLRLLICLWLLFLLPPSLADWSLTGSGRITPRIMSGKSAQFVKLS